MRIVPFPTDEPLPGQEAFTAELEAALRGESQHPDAHAWRELRDDVRALALAMTPAFEVRLAQELERRGALEGGAEDTEAPMRSRDSAGSPRRISAGEGSPLRSGAPARHRRAWRSLASHRGSALGAAAIVAVALVAALLISGSHGSESRAPTLRTPAVALGPSARGLKAAASSPPASTPAA